MKGKMILLAATLLCLQFFSGAYMNEIVPVLASMAEYFKSDPVMTSMIATIPAVCMIPGNLLSGKLAETVSNKLLLYVGIILFLIGGIGPVFVDNITTVLVLRGILGFGVGMIMPLAIGLIPAYFEGQARLTMMGLANAMGGLFATIASLVGGFLGTISWQAPFYAFGFGALVLLMVAFFLPEPQKTAPEVADTNQEGVETASLPFSIYIYSITLLVVFAALIVMHSTISSFVVAEGLGDAAVAGVILSINSLTMCITSLLFAPIYKIIKDWAIPLAIGLATVGFFIFFVGNSYALVLIGSGLIGITMGLINPTLLTKTASDAPTNVAFATSVVMVGLMAGQFLSSYWLKLIMTIVASDNIRNIYQVNTILFLVVTVIALVGTIYSVNKNKAVRV